MIINILYLLLFAGVQCCFGFLVQRAEFGPLNQSASIEEIHHDTPQTYIFGDDAVLKILKKSQTSKVIHEYEDATSNFLSTDTSHSINDTASNNIFAEKPSQIILVDKLKDKIVRVTNEIDKDMITLTMNDVQRSKRSTVTTISSSVPTLSHYSSKLAKLKNIISMMSESIEQLKRSKSLTNEDKQRFSTVEENVINLNNLIDNQSRETDDEMDKVKNTKDGLSNSISSINTYFVALNQILAEQELLKTECIENIKSRNFKAADAKLNSIEDESKINFIVNQVYSNERAHFNLVVEFGDSIWKINRKYLVYEALNYEMESNRHYRDPFKLIRLIQSLRNQIINYPYTADLGSKQKAESLVSNIKSALKVIVKDKLREGILNNSYASVVYLAQATYDFDDAIYTEFIAENVNEVYGNVSIEQLISSIPNEPRYVKQAVPAYLAVLDEMQSHGEFSTHAIFKIAYRIKSSIGSDNPNLSRLKNRLPESVRNAVFATKVCIKNVFLNKYLYRGDSYDDERGNVYTGISAKVREADWLIEPDGDSLREQFHIKNDYRSEYLYSARPYGRTFDSDRDFVFTWIPGGEYPERPWKIEPYGDNCFIKNVFRKEYLYSASKLGQSYDEKSGSVYTWIPDNKISSAEWKIEDCS